MHGFLYLLECIPSKIIIVHTEWYHCPAPNNILWPSVQRIVKPTLRRRKKLVSRWGIWYWENSQTFSAISDWGRLVFFSDYYKPGQQTAQLEYVGPAIQISRRLLRTDDLLLMICRKNSKTSYPWPCKLVGGHCTTSSECYFDLQSRRITT